MSRTARTYRMTDSALIYLSKKSDEWGVDTTAALHRILQEHEQNESEHLDHIAETILEKVDKKYGDSLESLRIKNTMSDRNIQILMEMVNTILFSQNANHAYTSRISKSAVWEECEQEVKRSVAEHKQYHDNLKKKK